MSKILPSIACNLDANILLAALPLFEAEKVQAIEWAFDTLFKQESVPDWFLELLQSCGEQGRLIGHGVFFSLFSGKWLPEQQQWLDQLQQLSKRFQFDHITEHFGFLTGEDFHKGAPISIPFTATTLALGQDRLKRIQAACNCPVGLENLAFSYSLEEVKRHGEFLDKLMDSVNGFIILDLHNLYCQLQNFDLELADVIRFYPLEKVREIHISGGSWEGSLVAPDKSIRRDTHDEAVPSAVFELLQSVMPLCPNLKYVVLEQLGVGLETEQSREQFRRDFIQMEALVTAHHDKRSPQQIQAFSPPSNISFPDTPIEDHLLYAQQLQLSKILENAGSLESAQQQLQTSALANSDWEIEQWQPYMLETALAIAQKWR